MASGHHTPSTSISLSIPSPSPSRSRPSSRTSIRSGRAPSPALSLDDPVAVRNHISTLKHTIRHQQAQVHELENTILRGPRPYADLPPDYPMMATAASPPPSSYTSTSTKMSRRSSFEVLQGIAGPESNLPLPRRLDEDSSIKEGIPMSFGAGPANANSYKRNSSPTRGLSRIPIASVGNARVLADEGQSSTSRSSNQLAPLSIDGESSSSTSYHPPPSPNKRLSLTPGGTTKVLADLQTGVVNARNALENTKAQLRLSQRSVAQLTRQTEDLKEGRERLRLENEGLNNVVARKERLLQEVLERARKAESEASQLKSQLKNETSTSKKTLREMESALTESTALSQKSEREYITLRDSIKGLVEGWKTDTEKLREEMRKREERLKTEAEVTSKKYRQLLEEVKGYESLKEEVHRLREEDQTKSAALEKKWTDEVEQLRKEVDESVQKGQADTEITKNLALELARLRRLMQNAGRTTPPPT
ncbi:hypothetical protein CPB85DRAFT_1291648 [Mucidula mucida]|nr:hypothetical protein CPB85DRAFT_1291648 [Mucidula mucida]